MKNNEYWTTFRLTNTYLTQLQYLLACPKLIAKIIFKSIFPIEISLNNYDIRALFIAPLKCKDDEYINGERSLNSSIFEERSKTDKASSSNLVKESVKQQ